MHSLTLGLIHLWTCLQFKNLRSGIHNNHASVKIVQIQSIHTYIVYTVYPSKTLTILLKGRPEGDFCLWTLSRNQTHFYASPDSLMVVREAVIACAAPVALSIISAKKSTKRARGPPSVGNGALGYLRPAFFWDSLRPTCWAASHSNSRRTNAVSVPRMHRLSEKLCTTAVPVDGQGIGATMIRPIGIVEDADRQKRPSIFLSTLS